MAFALSCFRDGVFPYADLVPVAVWSGEENRVQKRTATYYPRDRLTRLHFAHLIARSLSHERKTWHPVTRLDVHEVIATF
jgi:hypothetical protein